MKTLVLSGVNMTEGGILTIFRNVLDACIGIDNLKIICLVHKKELFTDFLSDSKVEFLEFPEIKKNWFNRIKFEFFTSYFLSKKITPDLWLCLHDISANIHKCRQIVYCHNPSPFYKTKFKDLNYDKKFFLFTLFYKYLYKLNIKRNSAIIVQQEWIADFFSKKFNLNNLVVAKPITSKKYGSIYSKSSKDRNDSINLFYPAFPRVFKNFEIIIESLIILRAKNPIAYNKLKVFITLDELTNKYSCKIYNKIKSECLDNVVFMGIIPHAEVCDFYIKHCDYLIFPSLLETWGLPLSEARDRNLPIISIDLPYAHETLDGYKNVIYFNKKSPDHLAGILSDITDSNFVNFNYNENSKTTPRENYNILNDWDEFRSFISTEIFGGNK